MTTGEKIAVLRRKRGLTQEQLSEILNVSRQSVSRWEMDAAFPETEKLVKLSRLLECSIDFLLNTDQPAGEESSEGISPTECYRFIRECGYFFLATSFDDTPKLRPMGMIYCDGKALFLATDKRKNVYTDLIHNPKVELASYNLNSRKWLRISGRAEVESSLKLQEEMLEMYPMLKQEYIGEEEIYFVMFRLVIENCNL